MSRVLDDVAWVKVSPGCWSYGPLFAVGWSDPRLGATFNGDTSKGTIIRCRGPEQWVVYIGGVEHATVENWTDAKQLAALLMGAEEAQ